MRIGNKQISVKSKPYIIAEMSGNHNKSIETAKKIIEQAANCGVDAVKLQTYTPDTLTLDVSYGDFKINNTDSLWNGKCLYDLYQEAYTPWEWHKELMDYSRELGLVCFSTPFDETAVDFLEKLNVPAYKISSFENNHIPLIKKVAETGKPLIISTGMASLSEIEYLVDLIRDIGVNDFALLKCTSSYPSHPRNSNIKTIPYLRKIFNCEVGLSDHTLGIGAAIAAVAQGASIIEKHLTLSREDGGVDAEFSLEPNEITSLVNECNVAHQSLGNIQLSTIKEEKSSMSFRRSIYISKDINKGEELNCDNIKIVRPGYGLKPKYYDKLLGSVVRKDCKKGTPVKWSMLNISE